MFLLNVFVHAIHHFFCKVKVEPLLRMWVKDGDDGWWDRFCMVVGKARGFLMKDHKPVPRDTLRTDTLLHEILLISIEAETYMAQSANQGQPSSSQSVSAVLHHANNARRNNNHEDHGDEQECKEKKEKKTHHIPKLPFRLKFSYAAQGTWTLIHDKYTVIGHDEADPKIKSILEKQKAQVARISAIMCMLRLALIRISFRTDRQNPIHHGKIESDYHISKNNLVSSEDLLHARNLADYMFKVRVALKPPTVLTQLESVTECNEKQHAS